MRSRLLRLCHLLALAVCVSGSALALADRADAGISAAAELAQRYSPIAVVQRQVKLCGPGEAYRPTVVQLLLNNPEVVLRNSAGQIVARAPSAQLLADAPAGDYVDLPGNPLTPGCTYERDFRRWFAGRSPTVYAHVITDPDHPGKLALQFWFFYTFNDFTNRHEADWEMMQLDFNATSAAQALRTEPYQVDLAQHAGGERGAWTNDPKLSKQGNHPILYIATGSHASFFQAHLYLGKGGSAVFGCDDTRAANLRVPVETDLVPSGTIPPTSDYAWLNFQGRWGQKEAGINNGVHGPASAQQWEHPISWANGLRDDSLIVPGARVLGLSVTSFFCSAVGAASVALNWWYRHPPLPIGLACLLVLAIVVVARRTRWRSPELGGLRRERASGQILVEARRVYRDHRATFVGIGLIFIPVAAIAAAVQWLLFHLTPLEDLVALDGRRGGVTIILALLIGDLAGAFSAAAVTAATASALDLLDSGRKVSARQAYGMAARRGPSLSAATAWQIGISALLALTVIGIPFAIYRLIRTSLFVQECVLDDRSARGALRGSARLTRKRWWRTFGLTAFINVLAILSGPVIGVIVLLFSPQSLISIDVIGSLIYALVVPYAAIALTLYYFDLQARSQGARAA